VSSEIADLPPNPAAQYATDWLRTARDFMRLSRGFWSQSRLAWSLTLPIIVLVFINLGLQFGLNDWTRRFFDALERRQELVILHLIGWFLLLVAGIAFVAVMLTVLRMRLTIRWREWLTRKLLGLWLNENRVGRLREAGLEPANPEYRITDDVRMALEPVVDLSIGTLAATLTALTFFSVLWSVGGTLSFSLLGTTIAIPAFFVFASLGYSGLMAWLTVKIGSPLIERTSRKNEAEARLRFNMVQAREANGVFTPSDQAEESRNILDSSLEAVIGRWLQIAMQQGRLTWIINGNAVLAPVLPLLLATPKFLSGELSLGAVTQIAAAAVQVQVAVNVFIENFARVAEWHASARRIDVLIEAIEKLERDGENHGGRIVSFAKTLKS